MIYKVPLRDSESVIYLCLLLEFQSTVYRFMALRSLQYKCDFYMDYVLSNKNVRSLQLPAMFPLILYNGDDKWTAPDNLDDLVEKAVDLGEYTVRFKHCVIAENDFGREGLLQIRNIVSTLFLAETHYEYTTLRDELLHLCDTEQDPQALELFLNWLRQLAQHGQIDAGEFEQIETHYRTREEMKSMLVKALEQERANLRQEGYQQGITMGRAVAQRQTLLHLLQWRFTPTPAETEAYAAQFARITNLDHMVQLIDHLLTAPTLAVFAEQVKLVLPPVAEPPAA